MEGNIKYHIVTFTMKSSHFKTLIWDLKIPKILPWSLGKGIHLTEKIQWQFSLWSCRDEQVQLSP